MATSVTGKNATLDATLGTDPVLTAKFVSKAAIDSSGKITWSVSWTLDAIPSGYWWGMGVWIQYRTATHNGTEWVWGSWTTAAKPITISMTTWSKKTGSFSVSITGCNSKTNGAIQFRLRDDVDESNVKAGSAVFHGVDVVAVTVSAGSNIKSVTKSPNQSYHLYGDTITVSCQLQTATGYQVAFKQWTSSNTDAVANNTKQSFSFTCTADETVTLTASATKTANKGSVYYYPNGGAAKSDYPLLTSGDYSGASSKGNSFTYEDTSKDLWNPSQLFTRAGYHIESVAKAWRLGSSTSTTYLDADKQDMSSHVKDKTGVVLKCYANWVANTYTIEYNANGGSGEVDPTSHTYDASKELAANSFERTGYTFVGWSTTPEGDVEYSPEEAIKNLTAVNGDTVVLYAVWKLVDLIRIGLNGKWNKVLTYIGKDGEWQRVKIRSGVDGKWT